MALFRNLFALVIGLICTPFAGATEEGCGFPESVLQKPLAQGQPTEDWKLPLSPEQPQAFTEARLSVTLLPPAGSSKLWTARIHAHFPDPKPFGIPYSFEKLAIRWLTPTGGVTASLDWTESCSQPGKSLFPGQSWSQEWEIPGTEGFSDLKNPSAELWGSRN